MYGPINEPSGKPPSVVGPIQLHVMPRFTDEWPHVADVGCWCHPFMDFKAISGNEVWVHGRPN